MAADSAPPTQTAPPPPPPTGGRARLTRRARHRKIAGVASGIADFLGVEPTLVRVGFVLLTIFGGSGVWLYTLGWVLMRERGASQSIAERWWRERSHQNWVPIVIAVVAAGFLLGHIGPWQPGGLWPLVLIGTGVLLFRSQVMDGAARAAAPPAGDADPTVETERDPAARWGAHQWRGWHGWPGCPPGVAEDDDDAATAGHATAYGHRYRGAWPPRPPRPPRAPRQPSYLGRLTFAALLLVFGGALLLDRVGLVSLTWTTGIALALTVVGGALLLGAIWGRGRGLIIPAILLGAVLMGSSTLDRVGLSAFTAGGGVGERSYSPESLDEVDDTYQLSIGDFMLDLSEVRFTSTPHEVEITQAVGDLTVIVPDDTNVTVTGDIAAGSATVFGEQEHGLSVPISGRTDAPEGAGALDLEIHLGVGEVAVRRAGDLPEPPEPPEPPEAPEAPRIRFND